MATPNSYDELFTHTLENRTRIVVSQIEQSTALLSRLSDRGNVRPFGGGRTMIHEISYQENAGFGWYLGYDTLSVQPTDMLTYAEFEIKQCYVPVSISGLEMLQNSGPEAVLDLMEQRIANGEETLVNNLSAGAYSNGTGSSGKEMGGLQLLVADNGQGTVGGIPSATWSFWRNQFYDFSANSVTPGPSTIQTAMNTLYLQCAIAGSRNKRPDLIPCDNTYFRYYLESLQPQQRLTDAKLASAGFNNLKFMDADVVFDGGLGGDAPASHMYFLNTRHIFYRPHRERNVTVLRPDRYSTNQDAMVRLIGWAGNMTVDSRRVHGVIVA